MRVDRQPGLHSRIARFAASLGALAMVGLYATAPASAQVSFTKAWGWGVLDGKYQFQTCTITCQSGLYGTGAGAFRVPHSVAVENSGDVFVADSLNSRVEQFSSAGSFIRAWGWGVLDGKSQLETCTVACQGGIAGGGAGQLNDPFGVAVDRSGDVFVADSFNNRVDEFSSAGAFIKAWGWGVADGKSQPETCTTICQAGTAAGGPGGLYVPYGVTADGSGDVFVVGGNYRVDEFSSAGAFIKAWGWGVLDGKTQLETCTATCRAGFQGYGAGQLYDSFGIAVDGAGDVFVADYDNRVDEFSSAGAFIKAWGWGVLDGKAQLETCTTTCQSGIYGGGSGQLEDPHGVAVDGAGDVFVADHDNRVDEFSSAGAFVKAWGWGVLDGKFQFETCTTTCQHGLGGGGAGSLTDPQGVAVDGSDDVFVIDNSNARVDAFRTTSIASRPSCTIRVASAEVLLPVKKTGASPKGTAGRLRFHVRCDQSASVALTGKVTALLKRAHGKNRPKTFKVAAVRGSVTAGTRVTLTVKLPQAALAALVAGAHESALFTLTATNVNGTSTATVKVARLKPAKA